MTVAEFDKLKIGDILSNKTEQFPGCGYDYKIVDILENKIIVEETKWQGEYTISRDCIERCQGLHKV